MNNFNEFLKYIHGENKSIVKVYKYIKNLQRKSMQKIKISDIEDENKLGDIYYIVNSGSDKNEGINKYNALFVDLDCGSDENKNYFSLDKVKEYKINKLKEIREFELKPTFIIETRNGLHVYWVLEGNVDLESWKTCIDYLIKKFNGDAQVNNPARLMRLPFTKWMKDENNPFDINIVEFNDIRYEVSEILEKCGGDRISINKHLSITTTKTPEEKIFQNQNEFYNYITQEIDLHKFLGVSGNTFNCVFHDDKNPSAGIFISERGQKFYKCHSSNCGFMGNIIRCVERLNRCNRPKAIEFIKRVYNLKISETEWQKEQKLILEENKRMIRDGELEEYYPELYKLIKNYKDLIYLLHDIAIDNVYDEKFSDSENNVVFFASLTKLMKDLNYKNSKRIADRNALLAFLQLISKLSEDAVPEIYLTKAKHIAAKNKQKSLVNFYSIPSYCDETLDQSLQRAFMFKDNNLSMRGWSRELLQRTFGDEIANEVYPQFSHRKVSKQSEERTEDIHKVVLNLLENKPYVVEKEIIEVLRKIYGKTNTEVQIKKSLQEMLDTYGLKRVRCNNEIKQIYGVSSNGYPFIIVKE